MRAWALVLVLWVSPVMAAPPDIIGQAHWLWAPRPKASPTVPVPVPASQEGKAQPETKLAPAPESVRAIPGGSPLNAKAKPSVVHPAKPKPHVTGLSCSEARQGVGMPCFLIRANAYRYEQLSPAQKRQADSCLTAAEREAIRACFR